MAIDVVSSMPVHPTKKAKVRDITPFSGDVNMIVVHTTNTDANITAIAKYDVSPGNHISSTGCPTYTYHDTIKENAKVYHCVPYKLEVWHAGNFNFKSLAVALNFIAEKKASNGSRIDYAPNSEMLKSLYKHLGWLCLDRGISPKEIYGHRELKNTGFFWSKGSKVLRKTCPGILVDLDLMRLQATKALQLNLKANNLYKDSRIDGIFGPLTFSALKDYHSH